LSPNLHIETFGRKFSLTRRFSSERGYEAEIPQLIENDQRLYRSNIIGAFSSMFAAVMVASLAASRKANAAKGAFELDAEFYARNLLGIKSKRENERKRVLFPSPRNLDAVFAASIIEIIAREMSNQCGLPPDVLKSEAFRQIPYYLSYFRTFVPIKEESYRDQYFFDISLYLLYLTAERLIPKSENRVSMRSNIGCKVLLEIKKIISNVKFLENSSDQDKEAGYQLVHLIGDNIPQILDVFVSKGIISGYLFNRDDIDDDEYNKYSFTEVSSLYLFQDIKIFLQEFTTINQTESISPLHFP